MIGTRAVAVLRDKREIVNKIGTRNQGILNCFDLEVVANDLSGSRSQFRSEIAVPSDCYNHFEVGADVEVIFPSSNPRAFEVVRNLKINSFCQKRLWVTYGFWTVLGSLLAWLSAFQCECGLPVVIIAFGVFGFSVCTSASFLVFPYMESVRYADRQCEVRPAEVQFSVAQSTVVQAQVVGNGPQAGDLAESELEHFTAARF
eukprot:TRINITY_DN7139_c0_g3_i1.p1 TRINITY_DN7139_c0_g3~~TRINITY_DN7139_c0_g3_i1.p1  ORF type:complete len:202 (+),score=14.70 TRINITY_DN7139_c0_g3_i1:641-1246(+)